MKSWMKSVHSRRSALALLLLITQSVWSPASYAKVAPGTDWLSLRGEHFDVHTPPESLRFANRILTELEAALPILSRDLQWVPPGRIDVVIRTDLDYANGQAATFPSNRIVLNATPFQALSIISEDRDWVRTLAVHELTHLIANDSTRGLFQFGRTLFGSIAKVNSFQPSWIMEGLAVYEETRWSDSGRGRSTWATMMVRALAAEGKLNSEDFETGVTLDRLGEGAPHWFGGHTPYLLGYVMQEMEARTAKDAAGPGKVSHQNSGTVPYFLNTAAEAAIGRDYYDLWTDAVHAMEKDAREARERIRSEGPVSTVEPISKIGRATTGLALSRKDPNQVYVLRDSYETGLGLSVLNLANGAWVRKDLTRWTLPFGASLRELRDGALLYSRLDEFEEFKTLSDLYAFDPSTRKEVRLTRGMRAFDPDATADAEIDAKGLRQGSIVYVRNTGDGNQSLMLWKAGESVRELWKAPEFARIATPVFAGEQIFFFVRTLGEGEQLYSISTKKEATPTKVGAIEAALGKGVSFASLSYHAPSASLLFSADPTGVYDVYQWKIGDPRVERLTRLETGALWAAPRPDGKLAALTYGARGWDVGWISKIDASPKSSKPPETLRAPGLKSTLGFQSEPEQIPYLAAPTALTGEAYSAWRYLLPDYWLPYALVVSGGWQVGAFTSTIDPLEHHSVSLFGAYDTRANFPIYSVAYRYEGIYPTLSLSRVQENRYLSGLGASSNRGVATSIGLDYPFGDWSLGFGATHQTTNLGEVESNQGGFQARVTHATRRVLPKTIERVGGDSGHQWDAIATGFFIGPAQFSSLELRADQRWGGFGSRDFFRLYLSGARSTNLSLSSNYYVGGGEDTIALTRLFLVRGYGSSVLFGRTITAGSLEYWFPIREIFGGHGTLPIFQERSKARVFLDAGSAEYVNGRPTGFDSWVFGVGAQYLHDLKLFYHFPLTVAVGFNYGLAEERGGQRQLTFGLIGRFLPF